MRAAWLAAAVAVTLGGVSVSALQPGESLVRQRTDGTGAQTFAAVDGTECWQRGVWVIRPESVPLSACTPPPTTTVPPPTTTVPPPTTTTPPPTTTQPPSSGGFVATFDTPADFYDRFDTYTGNYCDFGTYCRPEERGGIASFPGSHDLACGGATTTRTVDVSNHRNLFWHCNGHVMTGMNTSGYAIAAFTPKQSFADVTEVCWDMSLTDLGGGKWANVVLVPEATYLSHPNENPRRVEDGEGPYRLDYVTPDFSAPNGPGFFNIQDLADIVGVKQFRGTAQIYRGTDALVTDFNSWTAGTDQATRFHHCFRDNGNGTLTYVQERATGPYTVTVAGSFPSGAVRVLFQDDTYDADKHGGTGFYTWHWDNISIR